MGNLIQHREVAQKLSEQEQKDVEELESDTKLKLFKGAGCEKCGDSGYQGRIGIFEVLAVNDKIGKLILERSPSQNIEKVAIEEGMITMVQDGYLKVLEGITTLEEVIRVALE